MPRRSQVRYYQSRKGYYTKVNGRQHLLAKGRDDAPHGPTWQAACRAYGILVGSPTGAAPTAPRMTEVIGQYLFHLQTLGETDAQKQERYANVRRLMVPAVAVLGPIRADLLRPQDVHGWLDAQAGWNQSTRHTAWSTLRASLNAAVSSGALTHNPVKALPRLPHALARGAGYVIPADLAELLQAGANGELGPFLRFLALTGCRPGEAQNAQAKHYRPEAHAVIFPPNPPAGEWRWKNAKRGRARTIFLTPEAESIVAAAAAARPDGYLFVNRAGTPWARHVLAYHFARLRKRPAVAAWAKGARFNVKCIVPYSFRHTFITDRLAQGCPIKVLADLCGTSVAMIERHYGHAHDDLPAMYRLFLTFAAPTPLAPAPQGTP